MAKIHFNKALEIDPKNELAKEGKQRLEQTQPSGKASNAAATSTKVSSQKPTGKPNKPSDQSGGGLFGLFGGKKK